MCATIHSTAIVDDDAIIGAGSHIWHWTHVREGARIGRDCTLGQNVYVAPTVVVGDRVKVQNNVSLFDGVILKDDVFCGPSTVFTNVITPRSHIDRSDQFETTQVDRGATLGANTTILCGITIGEYAFVGAGAVVTSDVQAHSLVIGNPARHVGWSCRCGVRLAEPTPTVHCEKCDDHYELRDHTLHLLTSRSP